MENLSVKLNREDTYVDITEDFICEYPETQIIGDVVYKYIGNGLYQPKETVCLGQQEYEQFLLKYWDLVFWVKIPEYKYDKNTGKHYIVNKNEKYEIYFACAEELVSEVGEFYSSATELLGYNTFKTIMKDFDGSVDLDNWLQYYNKFYCNWLDESSMNKEEQRLKGRKEQPASGLCRFPKPDKTNTYQGYPKQFQYKNFIAHMIEPGIYVFKRLYKENGSQSKLDYVKMNINATCDKEIAVIGHSTGRLSFYMNVSHMAIGRENFGRLREIQRIISGSFMHEFKIGTKERKCIEPIDICSLINELSTEEEIEYIPETGAQEIVIGMGMKNIELSFKWVFCKRIECQTYEMAYILGNKLVLLKRMYDKVCRREFDLRGMEELLVKKEQMLKCGIKIKRDIQVIDCKNQKEQEMLKNEAYTLWKENEIEMLRREDGDVEENGVLFVE
ncbi:MAG: hypothetical protein J6A75_02300 [Lachnospiraceae bacterium]|nr:hypothetical protein [Lachnospiraceae bacterium]